jgi:O-antigen ligase
MKQKPKPPAEVNVNPFPTVFAAAFGAFLGLCLLKFGNPPIMEKLVTPPTNGYEFVLGYPWPINWAYWLLALVCAGGLIAARDTRLLTPKWLIALPAAWLIWDIIAGTQSVDAQLTIPTLKHLAGCVACFYLGLFALKGSKSLSALCPGLFAGFLLMLAFGFEQHFGGLAEMRHYFYTYQSADLTKLPPEYLKKLSTNRIWSTLFYANTLAGALLLFLPPLLGVVATAKERFTAPARWFLVGAIGTAALACLFWSGSKGGWLLMLLLGLLVLLRYPVPKAIRLGLVGIILVGGLAGFFITYSAYFKRGATSVGARFDYWRAAIQTICDHPIVGTGPGTFAHPYAAIKRPESEMARLVHNDYLEQASDSGFPAFLLYTSFIAAAIIRTFPGILPLNHNLNRNLNPPPSNAASTQATSDWRPFTLWLGVLGWALQSLFDFGLYIPAVAWPAFAFLGVLLGHERAPASGADEKPPNISR